jgi:DNA helicase-2/ATP-dependent DNA helicase PcrA
MPNREARSLPDIPGVLPGLNPPQTEAVEYADGHLLVLAGAGSGKTRVLTCKVARLVQTGAAEPWRILAVTFTNKAAGEMSERVRKMLSEKALRVRMGTFHSVCAWILRRESAAGGWPESFSIYDADDSRALIRRILRASPLDGRCTPGAAQSWISRCKNTLVDVESASGLAATPFEKALVDVYSTYQGNLRSNGAFDFDDLLTETLYLLRRNPDIGQRYSSLYRWILIDEYQDTNLVQRELLLALAGPGTLVCAVGDDDQSIYGWRGARIENILHFEMDFPGARLIRLEQNYRSTEQILRAASSLVAHNTGRHAKTLWTASSGGEEIRRKAVASPSLEASEVLEEASRLRHDSGLPYRSMAVLYRTNAQSREFETAALAAGIPYQIVGSIRFYEREEIKDLIAWLRVLANPRDRISLERVLNKPPRGIGGRSRALFFEYCDCTGLGVYDALLSAERVEGVPSRAAGSLVSLGALLSSTAAEASSGSPAAEVLDRMIGGLDLLGQYSEADPESEARIENINEFRKTAYDFDSSNPGGGLSGFLASISLLTTGDEYDPDADRLPLMTLHCAKGLEFEAVFIAGVEEGLLPFIRQGDNFPADVEEERRLLYVGITRARSRLFLTWCAGRERPGSRFSGPSRFLAELGGPGEGKERKAREEKPAAGIVYRKGNVVHHPRYGMGLVLAASRRGAEWQLTVDFGLDEPKILLTGYVPIPVVKEKASPGETF